jgi:hypothetical protein
MAGGIGWPAIDKGCIFESQTLSNGDPPLNSNDSRNELSSRIALAKETQSGHRLHDPIENDPAFASIIQQADAQAWKEIKGTSFGHGYVHVYWATKKHILKEKYGIHWYSPGEMNRHIRFD